MAYPDLDTKLPLRFGGQPTMAALTPHALKVAAREFKIAPSRAAQLTDDVVTAIAGALDDVLEQTVRIAGVHPILDRVDAVVRAETASVRRALLGG